MREIEEIDDVDGLEPISMAPIDDKSRFMTCRTKINVDSDYHRCHNPKSVAVIPKLRNKVPTDKDEVDRDQCVGSVPDDGMLNVELLLKEELSHLPFDIVLRLLNVYNFDVHRTIEAGRELVLPDLVPDYVKTIFSANVALERSINPYRGLPFKPFYFAKEFKKVVSTQCLVDLYYKEKNRIGSNFRMFNEGAEFEEDEHTELAQRLRESNIRIIKGDPIPPRQTRYQRAVATRRANQLRRDGGSDFNDNVSVDSFGTPSEKTHSEKSASPELAPEVSTSRSVATSTRSSLENYTPPKKRRYRKSGDEHRVGPRRSYPGRTRKPPAFFE